MTQNPSPQTDLTPSDTAPAPRAVGSTEDATTTSAPTPDQTERVILRTADEELETGCPCDVVVVDDSTGLLTRTALDSVRDHEDAHVFSWNASHRESLALAEAFAGDVSTGKLRVTGGEDLGTFLASAEAHLVLMRLPKSLAALESRAAALVASVGARREDLSVIAGGRVKHMSRSQNDVLARFFTDVHASRGLGKSRCLVGSGMRASADGAAGAGAAPAADGAASRGGDVAAAGAAADTSAGETTHDVHLPVRGEEQEFTLHAIGGVFGGGHADAGSLLLLSALDRAVVADQVADPTTVLDLGSGNGLLAAYATKAWPEARVLASDDDLDAVASTRATLGLSESAAPDPEAEVGDEAGGPTGPGSSEATWDTSASKVPTGTVDLVLLNPPFHDGPAVDPTLVQDLLDAAARVLRPGGTLWFVHNSHLRYRPEVERRIGAVRQRSRDNRFTVLEATRR
jgi:16S rRNA (guanine1207-N2)-methyltransferase